MGGEARRRGLRGVRACVLSDAVASAARPSDELKKAEARIAEIERVIGRQPPYLHFFREALRLWDATSPDGGAPTSYVGR